LQHGEEADLCAEMPGISDDGAQGLFLPVRVLSCLFRRLFLPRINDTSNGSGAPEKRFVVSACA
jgi:hypothetical protein